MVKLVGASFFERSVTTAALNAIHRSQEKETAAWGRTLKFWIASIKAWAICLLYFGFVCGCNLPRKYKGKEITAPGLCTYYIRP